MLDDSGIAVTRTEYLPFGETWFQEGDTKNAPKYNSQELDKESGYYFYNARFYDPSISRFVTADIIIDGENSTQGWNRYSYVHNNPIMYKDPTGHNIVVLQAEQGAMEQGHIAGLVENKNTGQWEYYSRNGKSSSGERYGEKNAKGISFKNPEEFFNKQQKMVEQRTELERLKGKGKISEKEYEKKLKDNPLLKELTSVDKEGKVSERYNYGIELKSNKKQDKEMIKYMKKRIDDQYILTGNNCKDLISEAMNKAGGKLKNDAVISEPPNRWFDRLMKEQWNKENLEQVYNRKGEKLL